VGRAHRGGGGGKNGSGDGSNAVRSGGGSVTSADGRRRGRRGGVLTQPMRKIMGEGRERGMRGDNTHFKRVGVMEQRRGWPGVVPHGEEVGDQHGDQATTARGRGARAAWHARAARLERGDDG
jgi:hypothetical protein